jgi:hypothetical protein
VMDLTLPPLHQIKDQVLKKIKFSKHLKEFQYLSLPELIGYRGKCLSLTYTKIHFSIFCINSSLHMAGLSLVKHVQLMIFSTQCTKVYSKH